MLSAGYGWGEKDSKTETAIAQNNLKNAPAHAVSGALFAIHLEKVIRAWLNA
jgi:hypothetical protein